MRRLLLQFVFVLLPKLLAGGSTAAISLLFIRHLSPVSFGVLSLCLSAVLIADALLGSAFDLAAVRLASEESGSTTPSLTVQWAAIWLKISCMAAAGLLAISFRNSIDNGIFHGGSSTRVLLLTLLASASILLLRSAQLNLQLQQSFRAYGLLDLAQSALKMGGVAVLLTLGMTSVEAVLTLYIAAPLLVFVAWLLTAGRSLPLATLPLRAIRDTAGIARWFLLTFALGTLIGRMDLWLVAHYTTLRQAGVYSAAQTLAIIPPMLGTYLSVVLSPRILRLLKSGQLLQFTYRLQSALVVCALVVYAASNLLLPHLMLVFPARFREAAPVLLLLLPGSLAGMISFPLTLTTLMFLRPRFLFFLDCLTAPIILFAYALVLPRFGLAGAAWTFSAAAVARASIAQIAAIVTVQQNERQTVPTTVPAWSRTPPEAAPL